MATEAMMQRAMARAGYKRAGSEGSEVVLVVVVVVGAMVAVVVGTGPNSIKNWRLGKPGWSVERQRVG